MRKELQVDFFIGRDVDPVQVFIEFRFDVIDERMELTCHRRSELACGGK